MSEQPNKVLKNLHLIISVMIVIPAGIVYGSPSLLPLFLDIQLDTVDSYNMMRAIMVLYLGVSVVWIIGIFNPSTWQRATELNILFMLTLAIGRLMSMLIDGLPSSIYLYGVIGELILGLFGFYQLRRFGV